MTFHAGHYDLVCATHEVRVGGCRCFNPSKVQDMVPCPGDGCPGTRMVIPERALLGNRQLQVLQGLADGKTPADMAAELYVSRDTVKSHLRQLYRKLDVSTAASAVAKGFREGLIT